MRRLAVLLVLVSLACSVGQRPAHEDPCEASSVTLKIKNESANDVVVRYLPGGTLRTRVGAMSTRRRSLSRAYLDGTDYAFHVRQATGLSGGPEVAGGEPIQCDTGTLVILASGSAIFYGGDV